MNFTKTKLSPAVLAVAYSQVTIGMLQNANAFDAAIADRGEGETDFCFDLLPMVAALAHGLNFLDDALECQGIDVWREFYQEFGRCLIEDFAGSLESITEADTASERGPLGVVKQRIVEQLTDVDMLSRLVYANVLHVAFFQALSCDLSSLAVLPDPDIFTPFTLVDSGNTLIPMAFNVETLCGESLCEDQLARALEDYGTEDEIADINFFEVEGRLYSVHDFMRCEHDVFGAIGAYQESAFSSLLMVMDASGDSFHVVRETC